MEPPPITSMEGDPLCRVQVHPTFTMSDVLRRTLGAILMTYLLFAVVFSLAFMLFFSVAIVPLSPFTGVFTHTASWGLSERDMVHVDVYLRIFESLYPGLISEISEHYRTRTKQFQPHNLRFWPHAKQFPRTWDARAGLFAELDSFGFPRKELYRFLGEHVEGTGKVTLEQREEYARL